MYKTTFHLVLIVILSTVYSCKKEGCTDPLAENYDPEVKEKNDDGSCVYPSFSSIIVGTWDEAQHLINGNSFGATESISFFSNGTYSTVGFTYPWHCEPCANNDDNGTWVFNEISSTLTLTSTKNQTEYCTSMGSDLTHDNAVQSMNVTSFSDNEFVVQFNDVNCDQAVAITFHR